MTNHMGSVTAPAPADCSCSIWNRRTRPHLQVVYRSDDLARSAAEECACWQDGWLHDSWPDRYFLNAFNLILSVHEIPPNNPTSVELRQYIEGSPR